MRCLRVKNFERFQHYKDRNPPWIKLYNSLLDDYHFAQLPDASKWHLVAIWLLASRSNNSIPADEAWVTRMAGAHTPVRFEPLVSAGFVELYDSASGLVAERKQDDDLETETEERENIIIGGALAERFEGQAREAYLAYRRAHRMPDGLDATLRAAHQPPTGGAGYDWPVIGAALVEMRGASVDFNAAALRGFCRKLVSGDAPAPARANGSHGGRQARNLEAIQQFLNDGVGDGK